MACGCEDSWGDISTRDLQPHGSSISGGWGGGRHHTWSRLPGTTGLIFKSSRPKSDLKEKGASAAGGSFSPIVTISGPRRPGSTSTSTSFSGKSREYLLLYLKYSHQKNLCWEKSLKSDNPHKTHLVPINQNYLSGENASFFFFFSEPQQITEKRRERAKNYEHNSSKHDFPSLLNQFSAQLNSTSLEICRFII